MTMGVKKKTVTIKYIKKLVIVSLIQVFLFSALFAEAGYAANTQSVDFSIRQSIASDNISLPQDLTFEYQLVSKISGAPMPSDSDLGKYLFMIDGAEDFLIEQIAFESPGIFIYEINCVTDSKTGFLIDKRTYKIEIHVLTNMEIFVIIRNNNGDKVQRIIFEHRYESDKTSGGGSDNTGGGGGSGDTSDSGNLENKDKTDITDTIEEPDISEKPEEFENKADKADIIEEKPKSTGKPGAGPKTGAAGNQILWTILMFLSGLFMLVFLFKNRKSDTNTNAATL